MNMATAKKYSASEAARAVNELLRLDSRDQDALLEVLSDYFCPPPESRFNSDDLDSDDLDSPDEMESTPVNQGTETRHRTPHCGTHNSAIIHFEGLCV